MVIRTWKHSVSTYIPEKFTDKQASMRMEYHSHANPIRVVFEAQGKGFDVICVPKGRGTGLYGRRMEIQGVEVYTRNMPKGPIDEQLFRKECANFLVQQLPSRILCLCCTGKPIIRIEHSLILISEYVF